jgi:hypothetical protein
LLDEVVVPLTSLTPSFPLSPCSPGQLALDTRGRNALAAAGCRLLLASALLGGLYIARRCVMLSS